MDPVDLAWLTSEVPYLTLDESKLSGTAALSATAYVNHTVYSFSAYLLPAAANFILGKDGDVILRFARGVVSAPTGPWNHRR